MGHLDISLSAERHEAYPTIFKDIYTLAKLLKPDLSEFEKDTGCLRPTDEAACNVERGLVEAARKGLI